MAAIPHGADSYFVTGANAGGLAGLIAAALHRLGIRPSDELVANLDQSLNLQQLRRRRAPPGGQIARQGHNAPATRRRQNLRIVSSDRECHQNPGGEPSRHTDPDVIIQLRTHNGC